MQFYQHERSEMQQFRSFKDVKRYIYLGFLPAITLTLIEEGEKFLVSSCYNYIFWLYIYIYESIS